MDPVTLTWPGGQDRFLLRLGELRSLQQVRDAGPEEIFNRLRTGRWQVDDLVQVIRWGLVGGGASPEEAGRRVTGLIDLHPLVQFKLTALEVVAHSLMGELEEADDTPGKDKSEDSPGDGGSPTSTAPVQ